MPIDASPAPGALAFPTRRELRAQREAALRESPSAVAIPVPPARTRAHAATHAAAAHAAAAHAVSAHASRAHRTPGHAAPTGKPVSPKPRRARRKNPLTAFVALLAIPALLLTTGLPAYAFAPGDGMAAVRASAAQARATGEAQGLDVAAAASTVSITRDSFTATTPEELAQRAATAKRAAAAGSARASSGESAVRGSRAEGDDYPWPDQTTYAEGGEISPLGYYYRECVDFVAWRLNRDAGSTGGSWRWTNTSTGGGSAYSWANAWKSHGRTTSKTPVVGAVAWFNYNHVAYVQSVPGNGTVVLEEYNWMGNHSYHKRTVAVDEVALYLYPPA